LLEKVEEFSQKDWLKQELISRLKFRFQFHPKFHFKKAKNFSKHSLILRVFFDCPFSVFRQLQFSKLRKNFFVLGSLICPFSAKKMSCGKVSCADKTF